MMFLEASASLETLESNNENIERKEVSKEA